MIEILKNQFNDGMPNEEKINRVREFLQIAVLKIMYDEEYLTKLAFVGGTALRLLYGLRRFSEDLDFSLLNKKGYNFSDLNSRIERSLRLYGLDAEVRFREDKTVQSAFIKFNKLLKRLGLSRLDEQKLSIKLEVDARPPKGWHTQTTLINKTYLINLLHFDLPSLYATKLHACFFRKYTKGRDFYDLVWYIAKNIKPNFALLNNAISQTEGHYLRLNEQNLKEFLLNKLVKVNFDSVKKDVERFLEDKSELKLLNFDVLKESINQK